MGMSCVAQGCRNTTLTSLEPYIRGCTHEAKGVFSEGKRWQGRCQNCGLKLRARDKYCSECGVLVGTIAAPPQAQE